MGALFYGKLDGDIRSTESDWFDDEEFGELELDLKQFEVEIKLTTKLDNVNKVFVSFFDNSTQTTTAEKEIANAQLIGNVINSKFLNGNVYKLANDAIWFKLTNLERLPSRSYTSNLISKFSTELFTKHLTQTTQSIYILSEQPSYDHQFEYYTNQITNDLKAYQIQLPIMFTRVSEGLLFEFCVKHQKKIHVFKLPKLLDEVDLLQNYLPAQIYNDINKRTQNYLLTSNNLYA